MRSSDYRRIAREKLSGNWGISVGIALVASILGGLVSSSGNASFLFNENLLVFMPPEILTLLAAIGVTASLLSLAQFLISGVVQLGYVQFLLKQYKNGTGDFADLFSQFNRFGQGFAQMFLRGLYIFLWSLLFVIPGIIKTYSYAMTPFIMAENPHMSASEAIAVSKVIMDGHKWELFCLEFSFIGWMFLSVLSCGIGFLFLTPYMNAALAAFYKGITADIRIAV